MYIQDNPQRWSTKQNENCKTKQQHNKDLVDLENLYSNRNDCTFYLLH